jgi:AraC-like DNA-binding protein
MRVSERLLAARGRIDIASLVDTAGCSHKHLVGRFREEIGITPKVLARVLRFGEAVNRLKRAQGPVRLVDLAVDCGYYDQAHFDRDCRAFAGVTPTELRRHLLASSAVMANQEPAGEA